MIFYVITTSQGETVGCETSLAVAIMRALDYKNVYGMSCDVEKMNVRVNAETVRRLLGNLGGYVDGDSPIVHTNYAEGDE